MSKNAEYKILLYILHLLRVIIVHEKVQRKLEVFQRQNMRVTMTVTYQLRSNYSRPGKIDTGKIAFVHKNGKPISVCHFTTLYETSIGGLLNKLTAATKQRFHSYLS